MSRASDIAYETIREHILTGALQPGTQLKETDLARLCGVSRTPVRDALSRLEAEMLVRRNETQRTFVSDWSHAEVEEVFTLRAMMEGYAAARAALHATPEQISAMRDCNDRMADAIRDANNVEGFLAGNREFHALVMDASNSLRLTKMSAMIMEPIIVHATAKRYSGFDLAQSLSDHRDLVSAFTGRDPVWAEAIMRSHIRRAAHRFTKASPGVAPNQALVPKATS
jgi:DNA-binding GntR family transcriptional regulator